MPRLLQARPRRRRQYEAIAGCDDEQEPPDGGEVPAEWVEARCIGTGTLTGEYVQLGHHETLAELRRLLAARLVHHGITDLDAAAIRLTAPRAFTQEISRHVFDDSIDGARRWNGIAYLSKHGDDLENWAIFEPAAPNPIAVAHFDHLDEDLVNALRLHGLHMTNIPSGGQ